MIDFVGCHKSDSKGARMKKVFLFLYGGKKGSVSVVFSPNRGAKSSGFTAIGERFTDDMIRGFPVIRAIVNYSGFGYEAMFGWIQIVTHRYPGGEESETSVDVAPQFQNYPVPYCFYGYKPTLYDAPCHNPGISMKWTAYSFLCPLTITDENGKKLVAPFLGLKWGYSLENGKVSSLHAPEVVGADKWNQLTIGIRDEFKDWAFSSSFIDI